MKTYLGSSHQFTSPSDEDYIELSAGRNERLRIEEIYNKTINSNIDTDALGDSSLSSLQNLQHTANIFNQGISTCMGRDGSTYYFGAGLYFGPHPDPTEGGMCIFSGTNPFTQYATVLVNTSLLTIYGLYGTKSSMNSTATIITFTDASDGSPSTVNIYKRTGAVWAIYDTQLGLLNAAFSNYLAAYDSVIDRLTVYLDNGTEYLSQQILLNSPNVTFVVGNSDNTIAAADGLFVKVYQRTGVSWALVQTLVSPATIVSLKITDKFLMFNTSTEVHSYYRVNTATGSLFYAYSPLATANGLDICSRTFPNGGSVLFVLKSTGIVIYTNKANDKFWTLELNPVLLAGGANINCMDDFLVCGRPGEFSKGLVTVFNVSQYVNSTLLIPNNVIDISGKDINLSSVYGSLIVDCPITDVKDLYVDNLFIGTNNAKFDSAIYSSSTTQAITTGTTILFQNVVYNNTPYITYAAGVFTNSSGNDMNLLVNYSIRSSGNGDINSYISVSTSAFFFGQNMNSSNASTAAFSGASVIRLPATANFRISVYTNTAGLSVSAGAAFQASTISFLRLPG